MLTISDEAFAWSHIYLLSSVWVVCHFDTVKLSSFSLLSLLLWSDDLCPNCLWAGRHCYSFLRSFRNIISTFSKCWPYWNAIQQPKTSTKERLYVLNDRLLWTTVKSHLSPFLLFKLEVSDTEIFKIWKHWIILNWKIIILSYLKQSLSCCTYTALPSCSHQLINSLLDVPRTERRLRGDRVLAVVAPKLCNSLPFHIRQASVDIADISNSP